MVDFLQGAAAMGSLMVALFFWRFWRQSNDRLFLIFGIAFLVFAVNRVLLSITERSTESATHIYSLRLAAFLLILGAIIDKNVGSR